MKKLIIGALMLLAGSTLFAEVWKEAKESVDKFWNEGNVLKLMENEYDIRYINKNFIQTMIVDSDEVVVYLFIDEGEFKSTSYSIKKYEVSSDENGNVIIKRIPKK